jgi:hypothetical protein
MSLDRRSFLGRTAAGIAGVMAYTFANPGKSHAWRRAYSNCRRMEYYRPVSPGGSNRRCKIAIGFPSCSLSFVTACSPNDKYWNTCRVGCNGGCYKCEPVFNMARAAACNGGTCSCTTMLT